MNTNKKKATAPKKTLEYTPDDLVSAVARLSKERKHDLFHDEVVLVLDALARTSEKLAANEKNRETTEVDRLRAELAQMEKEKESWRFLADAVNARLSALEANRTEVIQECIKAINAITEAFKEDDIAAQDVLQKLLVKEGKKKP